MQYTAFNCAQRQYNFREGLEQLAEDLQNSCVPGTCATAPSAPAPAPRSRPCSPRAPHLGLITPFKGINTLNVFILLYL